MFSFLKTILVSSANPPPAEADTGTKGASDAPHTGQHKPSEKDASRRSTSTDSDSGETTPKAQPATSKTLPPVPTFTLDTGAPDDEDDNLPPPSFPAVNSAQRASAPSNLMGPPSLRPSPQSQLAAPQRMAPPRLPPSSAATLRALPSGPLPNRGPPSNNLAAPSGIAVRTPNPRQKVQLRAGYSPLDWATLINSGTNLSGVSKLERVTPSMLKQNNGRKGRPAWSSYQGKVYNITPYLPYHPGGEGELKRAAGKDGAKLFAEVHPWVNWENMLGACLVGIMVSENDARAKMDSELEALD
ncbi:hypothetical protein EJ06DRAFT_527871 [Trichodelitschia bisporula]|uniref:Cytochrome b5 heme-binding domain-containing protein n=1 Tax=Trichodelitschia bisporula TaxID=703511 RepID=A0A6G1I3M6_9PEZI|nr:hypothetical protein EJ06DRAFT_527871 [Trichodelitschia bisporula]